MFLIEEYYLIDKDVKSHTFSIKKTFKEIYSDLLEAYTMFPDEYIIFPNVPSKYKDEFIKLLLHQTKDKSVLTIIQIWN